MRNAVPMMAALALTLAQAASAQTAVVGGIIAGDGDRPLDGASIEILGTRFRAVTTEHGSYRFAEVPAGRYWLLARRIGYAPIRISATLATGATRDLPFTLERLPQRLSEFTVLAEGGIYAEKYQDFVARSHSAFGRFLTRDDIASQPGDLVHVAQRYLPGRSRFTLEQRIGGFLPAGRSLSRLANANCVPAISFNGSRPEPGLSLVDFDREDVEALEIYRRGAWVPTEFATSPWTGCGLIVVWGK